MCASGGASYGCSREQALRVCPEMVSSHVVGELERGLDSDVEGSQHVVVFVVRVAFWCVDQREVVSQRPWCDTHLLHLQDPWPRDKCEHHRRPWASHAGWSILSGAPAPCGSTFATLTARIICAYGRSRFQNMPARCRKFGQAVALSGQSICKCRWLLQGCPDRRGKCLWWR